MFSERLKASRKAKRKTQRDLAAYLGISERGYQNYEMGKRMVVPRDDFWAFLLAHKGVKLW